MAWKAGSSSAISGGSALQYREKGAGMTRTSPSSTAAAKNAAASINSRPSASPVQQVLMARYLDSRVPVS
jgi:hypothetical protein